MNLNAYFAEHHPNSRNRDYPQVPRITCKDGFSLSAQASHAHYCAPRDNDGPWDSVEVGFPSLPPELIMPYAEDADRPTRTVYGYVPVELVEQLIELHGGIAPEDARP